MSDRLDKLLKMLDRDPADTFVLYGIALEHKKAGRNDQAIVFLDRVLTVDAGYCYAYFQKGAVYESLGDVQSACKVYREGIAAAKAKGDAHAQQEITSALEMIA